MTSIPIACTLTDAELAARREQINGHIFGACQEIRKLADGYAFRFPGTADWCLRLAEFIAFERNCCRFFTFELAAERGEGPLWLRLRGSDGVKEFVEAAMLPAASPA